MQRRLVIVGIVFVVGFGLGYGATWLLVGPPGIVRPEVEPPPTPPVTAAVADSVPPAEAPPQPPTPVADADVQAAEPVAGDAAAPPTEAPVAVVPAPDAPPAKPEVARGPEAECVDATCRLDFGEITGGISVRRGRLNDGQDVDWDKDFGDAAKIGLIPAGDKVRVEVRGIGYADGKPVAASVVFRNRSVSLSGVIALVVGDKSLQLVRD